MKYKEDYEEDCRRGQKNIIKYEIANIIVKDNYQKHI
ncbi:hypothetical protein Shell_1117 [Staphylothermus hellenicus DSM 12710]|uniref:Uncharacterized protein n=1 Tax=Staphylothermus hellenicus (strain DSM 12710 / JCM 10830 / BK20S6-10-b1 / P8) TaxID=591019 RepID=D7D8X3_STAHD|nr:hypothetical protein Shell_1117 [Staphylothermus hellenicus DSM 12710]